MGVGKSGGGGVSYGATVCNSNKDQRISFVQGPTTSDMTADKLGTTNAAKIKKLASVCNHIILKKSDMKADNIFTPLSSHD